MLMYIYRILSFIDIVLGFVIGFFFYIFFVCVIEWDALDFREVVREDQNYNFKYRYKKIPFSRNQILLHVRRGGVEFPH